MRCLPNRRILVLALAFVLGLQLPAAAAEGKHVVGWIERARVDPGDIVLKAKMDTGAKTTSLNVVRLERFSRNGRPWVRFELTRSDGKVIAMERPEVRTARIKRHGAPPRLQPVVTLGLCLDSVYKQTEVSLADRTGFNYQLLVGRGFLGGDFLVDPGRTFVARPSCGQPP